MVRGYWTESGFVESKGIPLITWENISSENDIFCGNDSAKLEAVPFNPDMPLTHYECKKCKRIISISEIIEAFQKVETAIEQELNVSILFYNGRLIIESTEFEGNTRRTAKRRQISKYGIEEITELFTQEIENILEVTLSHLIDLFQT
jgi:hypothetical protein